MKKVLFLILSIFLLVFTAAFAFVIVSLVNPVSVKILAQASEGKEQKDHPEIPQEPKEEIKDGKTLMVDTFFSLEDSKNASLKPTSKWEFHKIPLAEIQIKNLLGMEVVNLKYSLQVETSALGGVLTSGVLKEGKIAKSPFLPWKVHLTAKAVGYGTLKAQSYKDYEIGLYLFRKGLPQVKHFGKKIRIWADGKAESL